MARTRSTPLFIGIGGYAVALDPTTGTEHWRTKLKTSSFATIHEVGGRLFAGAGGELFCLDPATGTIMWHNKLKGLGINLVTFASSSTDAVTAAAIQAAQAAGGAGVVV